MIYHVTTECSLIPHVTSLVSVDSSGINELCACREQLLGD